jgi:hypothetical protein
MGFRSVKVRVLAVALAVLASTLAVEPVSIAAPARKAIPPAPLSGPARRALAVPAAAHVNSVSLRPKGLMTPGSPMFDLVANALHLPGTSAYVGKEDAHRGGSNAPGREGEEQIVEDYSADSADVSIYAIDGIDQLAVATLAPSNYQDEQGQWRDIDTSLLQDPQSGDYSNAAGPDTVTFPAQLLSGSPETLTYAAGTLAMTPTGVHDGTQAVESDNMLTYPDAAPGIDLVRYATPDGYEDGLVLKSMPAEGAFTWDVQASGFTLSKASDGSISMNAPSGHPVGVIPLPEAMDSASSPATDTFSYQLTDLGESNYQLSVVYDQAWLVDPARVFPVDVDPAPHTSAQLISKDDTYVPSVQCQQENDGGHGHEQTMWIGGTNCNAYAFVKFDVTAGGHVQDPNDVVYGGFAAMYDLTSNQSGAINAYKIKGNSDNKWQEWGTPPPMVPQRVNNQGGSGYPSLDSKIPPVCGQVNTQPGVDKRWWIWPGDSTGSCQLNGFDAGALYAEAFANREKNNGVEFRNDHDNTGFQFDALQAGASVAPYLVLVYNTLPDALTSGQLGNQQDGACITNGAVSGTDHPKLCVNVMPVDHNGTSGDPTRVMFQISDGLAKPGDPNDPKNWDASHIVASSPWLDCPAYSGNTCSTYPSWMPTSGLLRDGQTYWWRAVSGDWCTQFDPGSTDDDGVCPNVDAAGYEVPRNASPAWSVLVSLPHYGSGLDPLQWTSCG